MGGTSKSSGDGEIARKHHVALFTPREKIPTITLSASIADSSGMDKGIVLETKVKKGGGAKACPLLVHRHHCLGEKQDVWGRAVFE